MTTDKQQNYFKVLNQVNVNNHTETKGKFTYLSWPYAVARMKELHPNATWDVRRYGTEQLPFQMTECGCFVEVAVKIDDVVHSQVHPVLDNYNKPVAKPNAFQINTSIQRCLVKAIALHGLGLYIYAGEDLPERSDELNEMGVPQAERDEAKESYHAAVEELDICPSNLMDDVWESTKNRWRAQSKIDKWSMGQLKTFATKLERKEEEMKNG